MKKESAQKKKRLLARGLDKGGTSMGLGTGLINQGGKEAVKGSAPQGDHIVDLIELSGGKTSTVVREGKVCRNGKRASELSLFRRWERVGHINQVRERNDVGREYRRVGKGCLVKKLIRKRRGVSIAKN